MKEMTTTAGWSFALAIMMAISGSSAQARAADLSFRLSSRAGQKIYLMSELSGWSTDERFRLQEGRAGEYSLTLPQPWTHRLQYKFLIDGRWETDPSNPNRAPDGF